jgi:hypothetical protein
MYSLRGEQVLAEMEDTCGILLREELLMLLIKTIVNGFNE